VCSAIAARIAGLKLAPWRGERGRMQNPGPPSDRTKEAVAPPAHSCRRNKRIIAERVSPPEPRGERQTGRAVARNEQPGETARNTKKKKNETSRPICRRPVISLGYEIEKPYMKVSKDKKREAKIRNKTRGDTQYTGRKKTPIRQRPQLSKRPLRRCLLPRSSGASSDPTRMAMGGSGPAALSEDATARRPPLSRSQDAVLPALNGAGQWSR